MTETETEGVELWEQTEITAATESGDRKIPGCIHPRIPGLAVTMNNFGVFDVTHILSGKLIAAGFERVVSAQYACVQFAFATDWRLDANGIADDMKARGSEPCGIPGATITGGETTRPMTKKEIIETVRCNCWGDEFPWEGDEYPGQKAKKLLALLPKVPA